MGYEAKHTYEVQRCMNGGNCLRRLAHPGVYTVQKLAGITRARLVSDVQLRESTQWE